MKIITEGFAKKLEVTTEELKAARFAPGGRRHLKGLGMQTGYTECYLCGCIAGYRTPGAAGYTFNIPGIGKRMVCIDCVTFTEEELKGV